MNNFRHDEMIAASRFSLPVFAEISLQSMLPEYVHYSYLEIMGAYTEALIKGKIRRLIINMPPRHLKTYYTAAAVAYFLGIFPNREVIVISHSNLLAKELSDINIRLMESDYYRKVFPKTRIRTDRRSITDFKTTEGGGRLGVSFETGVTGMGADLIIVDDPLSAHDAYSDAVRQKLKDNFDGMIATRPSDPKTSKVALIAHRLHQDDLTNHLLEKGYTHLSLAFEAEQDEEIEFGGVKFTRKAGEVLQPTRYPPEEVARIKKEAPPHVYATQYQQVPTARGSGMVKTTHFPVVDSLPGEGETVISWDTASALTESASYSVALVFQVLSDVAYLRHVMRRRMVYGDLKSEALHLHHTFPNSTHLVEEAHLGQSLSNELREAGARVISIKPGPASKVSRLETVINKIYNQSVQVFRTASGLAAFLQEVTAFPHGPNDDQVDALSQFLNWWTTREPVIERVLFRLGEGSPGKRKLNMATKQGVISSMTRSNNIKPRAPYIPPGRGPRKR